MAYLGEFQPVASAEDSDKLDGLDSSAFVKGTDIGTSVEAHNTNIQGHIGIVAGNPHGTTAAQVGADPTGTATTTLSAHTAAGDPHPQYTTTAEAAAAAPVQLVAGKSGLVTLVKADVGLGNVDNTSDANKPVSSAVSTALSAKADLVGGVVPANQLPSYVDDVLEYANLATFPVTGESGKIYLAVDTNKQYRWSGSTYVITGSDLALGETAATAFRGDQGKTAYDHSQAAHAPSNAEANVQSDWNQATDTADDYIKNKPTLGTMAAQNDVTTDGKQYVRKDQAWAEVVIPEGGISVTVSGLLTLYVAQETTLTITNYDSATTYGVSVVSGSVSRTGDTITYTAGNTAGTDTLTITAGAATRAVTITVNAAGIVTPTNSTPANGATDQSGPTLTLTSSAFSWAGLEDTHASSDWELASDSGFATIVDSSYTDTTNKTSWTADVAANSTYYWRVKYRGASGRESAWSTATSFTTMANFGGLIGTAGAQGFGVGVYNGTLPSGFSEMTGTTDKASENYGNYQYTDGSVMCFVPRFYYRIASASSPRYATYGLNAVDIAGVETFADEAAANAAGYAMHRAFIDGGSVKSGLFIDKYLCSKNGTTSGKSIKNGDPISLTTNASYNPSSTMTGCTGILADAVVLSRARGAGVFNTASIFMYSALALLSLAHGQAATATTYCAWYDAGGTTNFPKGCNNGALADVNDTSVTFTVSSISPKPLTGSASNLAKTAHNGQSCGVVDLNGALYQVLLGLTDFGTSATDTTAHANGNVYLLKTSVALSSLTGGWDGTTDAWGNTTSLATKYDAVSGLLPWGTTTGWVYYGNGTNQVFDEVTSGLGYQRTSCGIQQDTSATSAGGSNQFGADGCCQYNGANRVPIASGYWGDAANAGVFYRDWYYYRSGADRSCGFRASAYGV